MKLLCLVAAFLLPFVSYGQSIRTLSYNSSNNVVIGATNSTNALTFSNAFAWSTNTLAAATRTNLALPWSGLTNSNSSGFRSALGLGWSALTNSNAAHSLVGVNAEDTVIYQNSLRFTNEVLFGSTNTDLAAINDQGIVLSSTNTNTSSPVFSFEDAGANKLRSNARDSLGLSLAVLTNTNNANFISALGVLATNGNAAGLTNFPTVATASNVTGVVALTNGGSGASNAQTARSNFFGHGGISTNISVVGTNNTNTLVFTNGLLMEVQ